MRKHLWVSPIAIALLVGTTMAEAQQVTDPRVADLVRAGKVRLGLFAPMYTKDPATGEIRRHAHLIETGRALAKRLGVELQLVEHPTPLMTMECLSAGACDVAFMGTESSRTGKVALSPPVFELDFTYLVPAGSSIHRIVDADRPGVRIAVVRDHVSTLTLSRLVKQAELVYAETPEPTFDLLRSGRAHAFASVGFVLQEFSARLPGSRLLEGRYGSNLLAMAVAKDRGERLAYITEFVEDIKASGLAQRAVELSGFRGLHVPPSANPGVQK